MRVKLFIALGMLGMSLFTYAGSRHAAETSYPSYKGLVMAGYQGSVFHVPTLALSKSGKGSKLTISSQPVYKLPCFFFY